MALSASAARATLGWIPGSRNYDDTRINDHSRARLPAACRKPSAKSAPGHEFLGRRTFLSALNEPVGIDLPDRLDAKLFVEHKPNGLLGDLFGPVYLFTHNGSQVVQAPCQCTNRRAAGEAFTQHICNAPDVVTTLIERNRRAKNRSLNTMGAQSLEHVRL